MRFGINALNFGGAINARSLDAWADLTEGTGFHFLMISDHVAITDDVHAAYRTPFYDPLISLGYLAGITSTIELGTTVLVLPYRHPLLVARAVANLDQLSGGRVIFGVGVGWAEQEFEALGLDFSQRGPMADEYLTVIRSAWAQDRISFDGRFVSFSEVHTGPPPARRPHPPIWVGGNSGRAMHRAARWGDAWHPMELPVGWLQSEGMPALRRIADSIGADVPTLAPRLSLKLTEERLPDADRLLGQGTPDQLRDDLEGLAVLGVEHVLFDTYDDLAPDSPQGPEEHRWRFELLAQEVLDLERGSLR